MHKNRGYKKGEPYRDARLFVVACEGEDREKVYFERLGDGSQRLKVEILAPDPEKSLSAPKWVLDRLVRFIEKDGVNIKAGDQVWIVMDVDKWKKEQLYNIANECKERKWGFALSNPCFEIWLLLHVKDIHDSHSISCQGFKKELGEAIKGGYDVQKFIPLAPDAITRCKNINLDLESPIPPYKTSRVCLLVSQMIEILRV